MSLIRCALGLSLGCIVTLIAPAVSAQVEAYPPPSAAPIAAPARTAVPPPPERDDGWFAGQRGLTFKANGGFAYRRIFAIAIVGADLGLGLGAQTRSGGWFGNLGLIVGQTDGGLDTKQIAVGGSWEAPFDRLHAGLGIEITYLSFDRVSTNNRIADLGMGANLFATYDLYLGESMALSAGLKGTVDVYSGGEVGVLYGATAGLGLRFF